jgi:RHS repeat-associated protein
VWDGNVPLHEKTETRTPDYSKEKGSFDDVRTEPVVTWVFEEGTFVPAAKLTEKQQYSIATNYLGTPEAMYREDGEAVWTCELNSYGKVRNWQGEVKTDCPFRYQGQYEDAETGLYYNRFRYYDPSTGVYLSQDPIGLAGGNPTLYGYVKDANTEVDLLGLQRETSDTLLYNIKQKLSIGQNRTELKGVHTSDDVMKAGEKVVGKNAEIIYHPDGKIKAMESKDGLRRFRAPQYKPLQGYKQANFEMRTSKDVTWKSPINIGTDGTYYGR